MSILGKIKDWGQGIGSAIGSMFGRVPDESQIAMPAAAQPPAAGPATMTPEVKYDVPERGVSITQKDLDTLRPLLFGEVSNRGRTKKELESRVILNTAINRMRAYAERGQPKSLAEILSMPNQYQAYGGEQYNAYGSPADEPSKAKKAQIDEIVQQLISEMESGAFQDNTNGAYYYTHQPTGVIMYDDAKPLFANQKSGKQ